MTTSTSNPPGSEYRDACAWTAQRRGILAALVVATLNVAPAQARSEVQTPQPTAPCPMLMLLMDFECAQYQQRRELAGSSDERDRIDREYWQLGEERRKSCRCNGSRDPRNEREALSLEGLVCQ